MSFIRITKSTRQKAMSNRHNEQPRKRRNWTRFALGAALTFALAGCAGLHGQPDGPDGCVGPAGFCQPYFGAG
ncbi:hypothetical protein [Paraburkholderia sp.]|uniref:hypothetical protein n=1 Tax=Paraburkholderia sp. TaxID=1926495 RepID=UPI0025E374F6|nr:hypothetical protein [Paraburkholderia sp.]